MSFKTFPSFMYPNSVVFLYRDDIEVKVCYSSAGIFKSSHHLTNAEREHILDKYVRQSEKLPMDKFTDHQFKIIRHLRKKPMSFSDLLQNVFVQYNGKAHFRLNSHIKALLIKGYISKNKNHDVYEITHKGRFVINADYHLYL